MLFAPITADDRYWFIEVPARTDFSFLEAAQITVGEIPVWLETGRVAPLAFLARRLMLLGTFQFSVATSTPLFVSQGIAKLLLLLLGCGACLLFIKSLRWRAGDRLVGIGHSQIALIGSGLLPLVGSGVQAHTQFRNGWISYPVLTYGAIAVVFGSGAMVSWSARRIAERARGAVWIGVVAMILLGAALNLSYELFYVAFPLALAVLCVFPISSKPKSPEARRAKQIIGGTLSVAFVTFFLGIRQLISAHCTDGQCYVGTQPSFGGEVLVTLKNNFLSSIPGLSHTRFLADLDELGQAARWPDPAAAAVAFVGLAIAAGVFAVWSSWDRTSQTGEEAVAERCILLWSAGISLGVGIGAALIMSLSVQAQEVIPSVGYPYRHTVLTWTSCALALVTLFLASSHTRHLRVRQVLPIVFVALVILMSSFSLPRNLVSSQVYRTHPSNRAIADIHWEIVAGDRSALGDERRCETLLRAEESINNTWLRNRLEPAADEVFQELQGLPYCSTRSGM